MADRMSGLVRLSIYKRSGYGDPMSELPSDPKIPDLISAAEAATMLDISRQAVVLRAANGSLLGRKVGSTWVFRRAVVERERDGH